MQRKKHFAHIALACALLALVACGGGGIGDILGGPGDDAGSYRPTDIEGSIVDVDAASRRITVETDDARDSLRPMDEERSVYYDERTVVEFRGDTYRPESLERGDEVRIRFARSGDRDLAERITVLRDVRAGLPAYDDDVSSVVAGTIEYLDDRERRLEIEPRSGDRAAALVYWDDRTVVVFEGREYTPTQLERGDEVRVVGRRRDDRFLADRITVERDATPGPAGDVVSDIDEVRGTVRSLDTRDRVIELDRAFGDRGDDLVYYDGRTVVELDGRELRPESLRDGDEVSVRGSLRDGRFLADTIVVVRESRG
jgi:hypothetical protein